MKTSLLPAPRVPRLRFPSFAPAAQRPAPQFRLLLSAAAVRRSDVPRRPMDREERGRGAKTVAPSLSRTLRRKFVRVRRRPRGSWPPPNPQLSLLPAQELSEDPHQV